MRKLAKRLSALLLATLMLLGASLSAMAVDSDLETVASPKEYPPVNVQVKGLFSGDTVNAYQLVNYTDEYNAYQVESSFKQYIVDTKQVADDDTAVAAYLGKLSKEDMSALLESYSTACHQTGNTYNLPTPYATDKANGSQSATMALEPGYYLLLVATTVNNSKVYQPMSVFVDVDGKTTIVYGGGTQLDPDGNGVYSFTVKSEDGPTLTKETSALVGKDDAEWKTTAAAGVGDVVSFCLTLKIPGYDNIDKLNMTINDTLTNMKYAGSATLYTEKPQLMYDESSNRVINLSEPTDYSVDVEESPYDAATGKQNLKFNLDYEELVKDKALGATVYLYYEAVVQKEAVAGSVDAGAHSGTNSATLTYANAATPNATLTTGKSETEAYNYYLSLTKFKKADTRLEGAEFSLYNSQSDAENATNAIKFVKVEEDGTTYYRPLEDGEEATNTVEKIEAHFVIRGLDAGTYYLREVTTPSGYYAPAGVFKVVLSSKRDEKNEHTGALEGINTPKSEITAIKDADKKLLLGSCGVDNTYTHQYDISLLNANTPSLPTTGGMGTMLFTIGGIALMGLAVYLFFFRKKSTAK